MSTNNTNNAFQPARSKQRKKGFLEAHGMAMGGGVLALGLMIVGSEYLQTENLTAELTDGEVVVVEENAETQAEPEAAQPVVTEGEGDAPTEEAAAEAPAAEAETETDTATEGSDTPETTEEGTTEAADSSVTTEEAPSAVSDDAPETSGTSSSTQTVITNPITDNRPLYADPVEGEEEVAETTVLITPAPTPVREPAAVLDSIPAAPAIPAAIKNAPIPTEGEVDAPAAPAEVRTVLPQ